MDPQTGKEFVLSTWLVSFRVTMQTQGSAVDMFYVCFILFPVFSSYQGEITSSNFYDI